ncbi:MAG: J domain-containing protein, partial [Alphaproteobacteria bacterium]|nr:J domain-containing protein [Alphaproteobacteria bacterium]
MTTPAHDPKGYYAILELGFDADAEAVKAAYRSLAKVLHPDHNSAPDAVARFQRLNEAYQVLGDARRRALYDARREAAAKAEKAPRNGPEAEPRKAASPPPPP